MGFNSTLVVAFTGVWNYARARWVGWAFLAILTAIAAWSTQVALSSKPSAPKSNQGPSLKHELDFSTKKIEQWRSSKDGTTRYHLKADSAVHYRDDLSSDWLNPSIVALTNNKVKDTSAAANQSKHSVLTTTMLANSAQAFNDGERIELVGNVRIERRAPTMPTNTLQSEALTLFSDTDTVTTTKKVALTQGKNSSVAQNGLEYKHADAVMTMNGPVRTTLQANP